MKKNPTILQLSLLGLSLLWAEHSLLAQTPPLPAATLKPLTNAASQPPKSKPLPRLGEAGAFDIPEERRLGDRIAQQIYRDPDLFDDPVLMDYIQSLWQPLQAAARARGEISPELAERFAWEIFLSRERSINAFALPGGYFGLHLGLLAQAGSADELASVLAHELSHVTQKHISRLIAKQEQQSVWMMGAMILGALAASAAKNADIAQAAIVGSQAVAAQTQLNFSRDMEREADRMGYTLLTEAGFEGEGFVRMFDRLLQASRHNDDGSFPYLRSHPLTTERLADMKARTAFALNTKQGPHAVTLSATVHALMTARARVWAEPDAVRWRLWVQQAQGLPSTAAAHPASVYYTGALAAWRLQDFDAAWRLSHRLWQQIKQDPSTSSATTSAATIVRALLLELASHPGAWQQMPADLKASFISSWLQPALEARDRASVLWAAQVSMLHRPEAAAAVSERLRWWVADHPRDAAAWQLLAKAWAMQQHPLRALRAEAESRAVQLDWAGAVDRLRAAQEWAQQHPSTDLMEQDIIHSRYRDLQQRLQEELKEQHERR